MVKKKRKGLIPLVAIVVGGAAFVSWMRSELQPTPTGSSTYVRFEKGQPLAQALARLQGDGFIRSASAVQMLSLWERRPQKVSMGTYELAPGMAASTVLKSLSSPVRWKIRIPEQNWARRTAHLLQNKEVTKAADYFALVNNPDEFRKECPFPIEGPSLEGYLFPDTYELAPLTPPKEIIDRQLKAFQRKVWNGLDQPKDLYRLLTIASLVELEVKLDEERPIVAGLIENRIAKGMPLQIDATVCYARQKWGPLTIKDLHNIKSPYNTYLNKGLPPGPICSPSLKSIEAALHPAKHDFLYYVAMPDGHQLFSKTMAEHEKNIKTRKMLLAQARKVSP